MLRRAPLWRAVCDPFSGKASRAYTRPICTFQHKQQLTPISHSAKTSLQLCDRPLAHRTFGTSSRLDKKSDKNKSRQEDSRKGGGGSGGGKSRGKDKSSGSSTTSPEQPAEKPIDINDYSEFTAAIDKAHATLRSELSKIKVGGISRDLEAIENIRVRLPKKEQNRGVGVLGGGGRGRHDKDDDDEEEGPKAAKPKAESNEYAAIKEIASVIPKAGKVHVLVSEKEHIKQITTTLTTAPVSLDLLPSQSDPSDLIITIPPITQEARQAAASLATQRGEGTLFAVREARGAHKKKLRKAGLSGSAGPDAVRRAEKEMEKMNEKAGETAKKMVEESRKRLLGK